ncbi:hypothetical protein ASG43_19015 [Aureimonas sp. Leaf454]|uniref:hypothetical protein n=1 Tax=Aureimonas sp. Leaf454 TaxID=1736381 RepID=UPI0006F3A507|nr:hypothetical protein [Aureimonas sp. Leaf454]KQT53305.1 hypothetical protein ASG43_19015 [Aureimonas sp. Leaf454]
MSFRVIVLDDNPDDRELVLRQVRAEFPGADTLALPDMNGLDEALARGTPGLVVTDLDLRWAPAIRPSWS